MENFLITPIFRKFTFSRETCTETMSSPICTIRSYFSAKNVPLGFCIRQINIIINLIDCFFDTTDLCISQNFPSVGCFSNYFSRINTFIKNCNSRNGSSSFPSTLANGKLVVIQIAPVNNIAHRNYRMKLHSRLGNCGSYCNTSFECLTTLRYNSLVVFGSTQSFDSSLRYSREVISKVFNSAG